MRIGILVAGLIVTVSAADAFAQSPLEGSLAAPDQALLAKPIKPKAVHRKPIRTAHRAAPPASPNSGADGIPIDGRPVSRTSDDKSPSDPVSFGMKWNGSNDTARDTRVQNYDGSNAGTGAEVGMKLHF